MIGFNRVEWRHTYDALTQFINDVRTLYQNKLIQPDENGWNRIASGNLLNSVKTVITMNDQSIEASLSLDEVWKYIEYGTRPHFPPPSALEEWIRIKPVTILPRGNNKPPTTKQLAYLIGRKISQDGTKAHYYLVQTIEEVIERYETILENAIQQDLSEALEIMLGKYFNQE